MCSSDLAVIGEPLEFRGDTAAFAQFGTSSDFNTPTVFGQPARALRMPACTASQGLVVRHGIQPNGGGGKVNQYSVVMDILVPRDSAGLRALFQTETASPSQTDADLFLNSANGVGIEGYFHGTLSPNSWNRLIITVDQIGRAHV